MEHGHDTHEEHGHHVVSLGLLAGILAILLFLTFVTVAVTWIDLGGLNVWLAIGVAAIKAILVGLYFMHLRWDAPFNSIALIASFVFLALFIGLVLTDSIQYQPNYDVPEAVINNP